MLQNFFKLNGQPQSIISQSDLEEKLNTSTQLCDLEYRHDTLEPRNFPHQRLSINGKSFSNFSFAKTIFKCVDFQSCKFEDTLFMGSIFENCTFHDCIFKNTNMHKIKFSDTYIDPKTLKKSIPYRCNIYVIYLKIRSIDIQEYTNIGVHLFQNVLLDAQKMHQLTFSRVAEYHFRKWEARNKFIKFIKNFEPNKETLKNFGCVLYNWLWSLIGYGVSFKIFLFTLVVFFLIFLCTNTYFWGEMEISPSGVYTFQQKLHYTFYTFLSYGSTPMAPTSTLGISIAIIQGCFGWTLLGAGIAMLTKKLVG